VIYQNRAAANERLENFDLALQDLQASIDLNNRSAYALYSTCAIVYSNGMSHEMDLAVDDMYG
jgi:hypothetical protein